MKRPERNENNQMWRDVRDGQRTARSTRAVRDVAKMLELQRQGAIVAQQLSEHHWRIHGIAGGKIAETVDYWPRTGAICKKGLGRLTAFGLDAAVRIARRERKPK